MVVCQQEADTSGFSLLTTQPMNGPSIAKVFIDETGEVKQEFISLLVSSLVLLCAKGLGFSKNKYSAIVLPCCCIARDKSSLVKSSSFVSSSSSTLPCKGMADCILRKAPAKSA